MEDIAIHEIYRMHMIDAKLRLRAAERVLETTNSFGLRAFDYEFCFLQIRRIVEDITFSTMLREAPRYSKFRKLQAEQQKKNSGQVDASKDWQAAEILCRLVKLSPDILPIPILSPRKNNTGIFNFDRKKLEVNHSRLIELYKRSGGFLHAKNPLSGDISDNLLKEKEKYLQAPNQLMSDLRFLHELLWKHATLIRRWDDSDNPCSVEDASTVWLIDFGDPQCTDVQILLAEAC